MGNAQRKEKVAAKTKTKETTGKRTLQEEFQADDFETIQQDEAKEEENAVNDLVKRLDTFSMPADTIHAPQPDKDVPVQKSDSASAPPAQFGGLQSVGLQSVGLQSVVENFFTPPEEKPSQTELKEMAAISATEKSMDSIKSEIEKQEHIEEPQKELQESEPSKPDETHVQPDESKEYEFKEEAGPPKVEEFEKQETAEQHTEQSKELPDVQVSEPSTEFDKKESTPEAQQASEMALPEISTSPKLVVSGDSSLDNAESEVSGKPVAPEEAPLPLEKDDQPSTEKGIEDEALESELAEHKQVLAEVENVAQEMASTTGEERPESQVLEPGQEAQLLPPASEETEEYETDKELKDAEESAQKSFAEKVDMPEMQAEEVQPATGDFVQKAEESAVAEEPTVEQTPSHEEEADQSGGEVHEQPEGIVASLEDKSTTPADSATEGQVQSEGPPEEPVTVEESTEDREAPHEGDEAKVLSGEPVGVDNTERVEGDKPLETGDEVVDSIEPVEGDKSSEAGEAAPVTEHDNKTEDGAKEAPSGDDAAQDIQGDGPNEEVTQATPSPEVVTEEFTATPLTESMQGPVDEPAQEFITDGVQPTLEATTSPLEPVTVDTVEQPVQGSMRAVDIGEQEAPAAQEPSGEISTEVPAAEEESGDKTQDSEVKQTEDTVKSLQVEEQPEQHPTEPAMEQGVKQAEESAESQQMEEQDSTEAHREHNIVEEDKEAAPANPSVEGGTLDKDVPAVDVSEEDESAKARDGLPAESTAHEDQEPVKPSEDIPAESTTEGEEPNKEIPAEAMELADKVGVPTEGETDAANLEDKNETSEEHLADGAPATDLSMEPVEVTSHEEPAAIGEREASGEETSKEQVDLPVEDAPAVSEDEVPTKDKAVANEESPEEAEKGILLEDARVDSAPAELTEAPLEEVAPARESTAEETTDAELDGLKEVTPPTDELENKVSEEAPAAEKSASAPEQEEQAPAEELPLEAAEKDIQEAFSRQHAEGDQPRTEEVTAEQDGEPRTEEVTAEQDGEPRTEEATAEQDGESRPEEVTAEQDGEPGTEDVTAEQDGEPQAEENATAQAARESTAEETTDAELDGLKKVTPPTDELENKVSEEAPAAEKSAFAPEQEEIAPVEELPLEAAEKDIQEAFSRQHAEDGQPRSEEVTAEQDGESQAEDNAPAQAASPVEDEPKLEEVSSQQEGEETVERSPPQEPPVEAENAPVMEEAEGDEAPNKVEEDEQKAEESTKQVEAGKVEEIGEPVEQARALDEADEPKVEATPAGDDSRTPEPEMEKAPAEEVPVEQAEPTMVELEIKGAGEQKPDEDMAVPVEAMEDKLEPAEETQAAVEETQPDIPKVEATDPSVENVEPVSDPSVKNVEPASDPSMENVNAEPDEPSTKETDASGTQDSSPRESSEATVEQGERKLDEVSLEEAAVSDTQVSSPVEPTLEQIQSEVSTKPGVNDTQDSSLVVTTENQVTPQANEVSTKVDEHAPVEQVPVEEYSSIQDEVDDKVEPVGQLKEVLVKDSDKEEPVEEHSTTQQGYHGEQDGNTEEVSS